MCTVIVEVPEHPDTAVRVLAVRDEDPHRPWDSLGPWWPDTYPELTGVRDRLAGGAWLAANTTESKLSVILNRAEAHDAQLPAASQPTGSRGTLVLHDAHGAPMPAAPQTAAFNLVSVRAALSGSGDLANQPVSNVTITSFTGTELRVDALPPGVHMIAHHDVNDARTERIVSWLPRFREVAGLAPDAWQTAWLGVLAESTQLSPTDDRAIIRDNRPHGYPTLSLLVCLAEVDAAGARVIAHTLPTPGEWHPDTTMAH